MSLLSNELLLNCFEKAKELKLDDEFIEILRQEMQRRGLA